MSTVVFDFHCKTAGKGRVRILPGDRQHNEPGNTPRITRLMALAIKFDQLLRDGTVRDYADLARLGHVTRARMTQIMGLLNLAVDIQEEILNLPKTIKGRDAIASRDVIKIAKIEDWDEQQREWKCLNQFRKPFKPMSPDDC